MTQGGDMTLTETLSELARARIAAEVAAEEFRVHVAAFEATVDYKRLVDAAQSTRATMMQLDTQARGLTLDAFKATGDKEPASGATVRLYKRVLYDVAQALQWCKTNAPIYVREVLDTKPFEKAAEHMHAADAPWTIEYDPRPTLATDLSEYLPK